ncbi:unnamed protein product [Anisakis simplex]|uniref:TPR_REGION domain-containing protein n=1 Tax=Anisakis simplex TaxID=6269 RepID=A0A0M3K3Z0_ANISI|nr:unnamed protein product [Anisakis simplex]
MDNDCSIADDNLTMDAEDSLPAIHLQSGAGSGVGDEPGQVLTTVQPPSPSQMETNDELSFGTQIMMLEQKELQTENVEELSAQFYSQLLAYYLIEQNWVKARLCRMRANACSNDAQLSVIIAISKHLENGETGAALKLIKSYNFVGLFK